MYGRPGSLIIIIIEGHSLLRGRDLGAKREREKVHRSGSTVRTWTSQVSRLGTVHNSWLGCKPQVRSNQSTSEGEEA